MMSELAARPWLACPRQRMRTETRAALLRLGMPKINPDTKVARLSVAEMQLVEIAAAFVSGAVAPCSTSRIRRFQRESERLFDVVRQLRSEGVAVVYVSHRLSEVLDLADVSP